jgi:hypothetical protein
MLITDRAPSKHNLLTVILLPMGSSALSVINIKEELPTGSRITVKRLSFDGALSVINIKEELPIGSRITVKRLSFDGALSVINIKEELPIGSRITKKFNWFIIQLYIYLVSDNVYFYMSLYTTFAQ